MDLIRHWAAWKIYIAVETKRSEVSVVLHHNRNEMKRLLQQAMLAVWTQKGVRQG